MLPTPSLDLYIFVKIINTEFLNKGPIQRINLETMTFYSHLFAQMNGKWRPIHNLKSLIVFVMILSMNGNGSIGLEPVSDWILGTLFTSIPAFPV